MDASVWSALGWFAWMVVGTTLLAWLPGWLVVTRWDPDGSPARRRAIALVVGPALVAVLVVSTGAVVLVRSY